MCLRVCWSAEQQDQTIPTAIAATKPKDRRAASHVNRTENSIFASTNKERVLLIQTGQEKRNAATTLALMYRWFVDDIHQRVKSIDGYLLLPREKVDAVRQRGLSAASVPPHSPKWRHVRHADVIEKHSNCSTRQQSVNHRISGHDLGAVPNNGRHVMHRAVHRVCTGDTPFAPQ